MRLSPLRLLLKVILMEIEDIKKLIELMEEKGVSELELKTRVGEVRLVRGVARTPQAPVVAPPPTPTAPASDPPPAPVPEQTLDPNTTILSPMVGTFYRAPNPDTSPYVEVGSVVEKGNVVCIIEAMKMMNEIQAELRGRIARILVDNAEPVEYGQPLFVVEPS